MKLKRRIFVAWASTLAIVAPAQVADLSDAINKAGRLRMLSQRMAKAYLCVGQQVQVGAATKALDQSMATFDRQLVELKAFAPAGAVRDTYLQLETEWSAFKTMLVGATPALPNAAELLTQDAKVLALAHKGTGQLEQISGKPLGKLVNIAGRQRMLSQRMAKYLHGHGLERGRGRLGIRAQPCPHRICHRHGGVAQRPRGHARHQAGIVPGRRAMGVL